MSKQYSKQLLKFISEDFGIEGYGRWLRSTKHNSLVIDADRGLFYWNSKEIFGGALEYLLYIRKLPKSVAEIILGTTSSIEVPTRSIAKNASQVPYLNLVDTFFEEGKTNRDYWHKRLLTDTTIDLYKLGYYNGWSTVPIFLDGELLNFQMRRDIPDKRIKLRYANGTSLFNSEVTKIFNTMFITEGLVDCILLNQIGIPAISKTSGALTWLDDWSKSFMKIKEIKIVFDNDDAGRKGAIRIAKKLGIYRAKIFTFEGFKEGYDIIDYFRDGNTKEDFKDLINGSSKYVFEYRF